MFVKLLRSSQIDPVAGPGAKEHTRAALLTKCLVPVEKLRQSAFLIICRIYTARQLSVTLATSVCQLRVKPQETHNVKQIHCSLACAKDK